MRPKERREAILAASRFGHELVVEEMATRFDVSRETIRRDLARLDALGLLRRVHGGAAPPRAAAEPHFNERQQANRDGKRRIAETAAGLFAAGETLMIDTGSTTEAFAVAVGARVGLTVITNSVRIAGPIIAGGRGGDVHVLGGAFRAETGQMLGSLCVEQLDRFRADHAVLGIGAISAAGEATDYDPDEAHLARAMMSRAARVTVLADQTKFDRVALSLVCRLDRIGRVVTDRVPSAGFVEAFRAAGTELVVAISG